MDYATVLARLCNLMVSTFYPDKSAIDTALFLMGKEPTADCDPKDPELFRCAVRMIRGYVEGSRGEGGVSVSLRADAIRSSLTTWCKYYGLNPEVELKDEGSVISDISDRW